MATLISLIDAHRLWSKANKCGGPEACWPWMAGKDSKGYGLLWAPDLGQPVRTHRLAWELTYGQIPPGLSVLHRCDNPPCCNPRHLFLGTAADNSYDMTQKGRQANGSRNGRSKLTGTDVLAIRQHRVAGLKLREIAERVQVSLQTVHQVLSGRTWAHVREDT